MCLLVAAVESHPDYRLVLAGHRDEFHDRPTAPLAWWDDAPDILAGRDLQAGGTWLGVDRGGRMSVVTNFRAPGSQREAAPSRGLLVPGFLASGLAAAPFVDRLASDAAAYSGFNLLAWDGSTMAYCGGPDEGPRTLPPGVYGLSNARLDTPWAKLTRVRDRVRTILAAGTPRPESLLRALDDRQPATDDQLPDTGVGIELERLLSAPFIVSPHYGTRCTTIVLVGRDGGVQVTERRYAPDGSTVGRTHVAFRATRPGPRGS
jgi:uncharacterized protein with NRDE domain